MRGLAGRWRRWHNKHKALKKETRRGGKGRSDIGCPSSQDFKCFLVWVRVLLDVCEHAYPSILFVATAFGRARFFVTFAR